MTEIRISLEQIDGSTSEAAMRHHRVLIDRPQSKGGTDRGAMGGELFLAALGGCFMSNLLAAINSRDIKASAMTVVVTGTLTDAPSRFSRVTMVVSGRYPDRVEMEKLAGISEKACIVANTVRAAVDLTISVSAGGGT